MQLVAIRQAQTTYSAGPVPVLQPAETFPLLQVMVVYLPLTAFSW